jgi:hypothetical protein
MRRRWVLVAPLLLLLAGCGLPPIVTAATWLTDGVLVASTGKSIGGHALSGVMERDCAIWRVIGGAPICRDEEMVAGAIASARESEPGGEPELAVRDCVDRRFVAGEKVCRVYADPVLVARAKRDEPVMAAMDTPAPGVREAAASHSFVTLSGPAPERSDPAPVTVAEGAFDRWFLVLSSFTHRDNAERLADGQAFTVAGVVPAVVAGKTYWRVVAGPFSRDGLRIVQNRAEKKGFADAWVISSCEGRMPAANCIAFIDGARRGRSPA